MQALPNFALKLGKKDVVKFMPQKTELDTAYFTCPTDNMYKIKKKEKKQLSDTSGLGF